MTAEPSGRAGSAVAALIRAANIELIPLRGAEEKLAAIPASTKITITCSPKFGLRRTLEYAELGVRAGHAVVPHLAARQVGSKAELREFIRRIGDLGITDLYIIGGDADEPAGSYREAADVLQDLADLDHGLERIGVACYPEGHPKIPEGTLEGALLRKQAYATYMVSQLCFDARALTGWLRATRAAGIDLPIRIGLAAPLKTTRLLELSLKIGVGSSIRYLTKQRGFVGNLLVGGAYRPEQLLYAIGDDIAGDDLNVEGLHLFSFNQVDITCAWQGQFSAAPPADVHRLWRLSCLREQVKISLIVTYVQLRREQASANRAARRRLAKRKGTMAGSLEDKIQRSGNVAEMLRNSPAGAYTYPMRPEFSNWRDEQRAWATTAVLFDQSFHMTDVYFRGPDALRLLSDLGVNSFKTFGKNKAKQFLACNYDGYVIGDAILFGLDDEEFSLVGRPITPDWVAFHAETAGYDVDVVRDERSVANQGRRLTFRYQLQGPNALKIVEKAVGGPIDRIKFFNIGQFTIAGCTVKALNHTMSGIPGQEMTGLEMMGPSDHGDEVMAALVEAGREFGLREGGSRAYPTTAIESGWIPSPLPAIYTGEQMKSFRQWLSEASWEANASIGGSFVSDSIEDYYLTPWDLGYGHLVKFDHDFIGRAALERLAGQPHKRKVWLRWNDDDVARIITSTLFGGEQRAKYMDMPSANYATGPYDQVLIGARLVGFSANVGYTVNIGGWSSLAMVDEADAIDGTEVTLVWGEGDGGSAKPSVERHVQTTLRATLSTSPSV